MKQFFALVFIILCHSSYAQQYQVVSVGFYNFENLFDTLDTPDVRDTEFTPDGTRHWTPDRYREKLKNLARVVSELGTELTPDGPAILGVAEVENRSVLEDFVREEAIANRDYQIVHYDSPDFRGIDVALLYQAKYFEVLSSEAIRMNLTNVEGGKVITRDVLHVHGKLGDQELHVLVNHWPSRRGGEKATRPMRNAAAEANQMLADSIRSIDPDAGILIMGDLNDDPVNQSVTKHIRTRKNKESVRPGEFLNPWTQYYKKGIGTLAYRDAWSLFDQILVSESLLSKSDDRYFYFKSAIYNPPYLIQPMGHYRGYPFRTFDFDEYISGYSDHFPVVIYLVRPL
ncbi:MAG: endonuclease/exonuclease/phosphatase family protein [Saprospiraceae bacterium]|nr:endonuclease/exonuclease/phosphatase family protein [Saprospiraceae bacterium]